MDNVSGDYVDPAVLKANLSPKNAADALSIYSKSGYNYPNDPPAAGTSRGNAKNDAYSTISIVIYYKVLSKTMEWWH